MTSKVSLLFFSDLDKNNFKGLRVNGYLSYMSENHINFEFNGFERNKILSTNARVKFFLSFHILKFLNLINLFFNIRSTLIRHIVCKLMSYEFILRSQLLPNDIFFTQPYFLDAIKYAKKRGLRVIIESDNDHPAFVWDKIAQSQSEANLLDKKIRDPWNYYPYVRNAIESIKFSDSVIVFNDHARSTFLERGISEDRLFTCIPPPDHIHSPAKFTSLTPEFVWVGNRAAIKGLHLLIEAWREYKVEGGNGALFICGSLGDSGKEIIKRINDRDNIIKLGTVNLMDFFSERNRVIVQPSYSEGFPRSVALAMNSCSPCILSEAAGSRYLDDSQDGWSIKLNKESIKEKLFLCSSNWKSVPGIGTNARKTINRITKDYYSKVFKEVIRINE